MRHVLVISHFFPPMGGGGVQRVTKFVKYLPLHGWRATVVCGRAEDYWMQDASLVGEIPASARVVRTAAASGLGLLRRVRGGAKAARRSAGGFALLRRAAAWMLLPDSYIGWRPFALRAARSVLAADPAQVIFSTGPPETNHLVALALHRETGLPWLADFRDPWFGLHLFPAPTRWHRRRHELLEQEVLRSADCLVATTSWLRDLLRARPGDAARRLVVIRNGYDPEDFPVDSAPRPDPEQPLRLAHTGMLTLSRSAAGLLRGLQLLHARRPELQGQIQVELVGARESGNDGLVAQAGLQDCVHFRGYVAHREAIAAMRAADALVLIKHIDARYVGMVPGKFYEYLGAGRPILALVPESEAASLVRDLGCGEVVAPDDGETVARVLLQWLEAKRAGTLAARYPSGAAPRFTRPEQARNLAALLDQIAPPGTPHHSVPDAAGGVA